MNGIKENIKFLSEQLITYLGNKRALLSLIEKGVLFVQSRLNTKRFSCADMFSGSGIVSRFLKQYSHTLYANDIEAYAFIINKCYLSDKTKTDWDSLKQHYHNILNRLENQPLKQGFITQLYSPKNDENILPGERVFYTRRNAMYLDTARQYIADIPTDLQCFLLAPLLAEASIHANTGGVFKGFYKNRNGIGHFGGQAENALARIKADIQLKLPILSNFESQVYLYRQDANTLASDLPPVDIAYLDPPYNQHPYGSNYFMLNLLTEYQKPKEISEVSGIPQDWQRSDYNRKNTAAKSLRQLCQDLPAKYILISFNSEGFISKDTMQDMLKSLGKVKVLQQEYPVFRASRNLNKRSLSLHEYLYILEK